MILMGVCQIKTESMMRLVTGKPNTNLEFVKRSGQSNYIYFTPGSGCSSYVGMVGGKQNITLADACSTGNTIHEIGHAIGLMARTKSCR